MILAAAKVAGIEPQSFRLGFFPLCPNPGSHRGAVFPNTWHAHKGKCGQHNTWSGSPIRPPMALTDDSRRFPTASQNPLFFCTGSAPSGSEETSVSRLVIS